jgi:hypothetical protein
MRPLTLTFAVFSALHVPRAHAQTPGDWLPPRS